MDKTTREDLIKKALEARNHAYVPYSHFQVGACLLADNGKCYQGANIENVSFGATICAERNAIMKAIYDGAKKIKLLAVASSADEICMPCGICRQVMLEFADEDFLLLCSDNQGKYREWTMEQILPDGFSHFE